MYSGPHPTALWDDLQRTSDCFSFWAKKHSSFTELNRVRLSRVNQIQCRSIDSYQAVVHERYDDFWEDY